MNAETVNTAAVERYLQHSGLHGAAADWIEATAGVVELELDRAEAWFRASFRPSVAEFLWLEFLADAELRAEGWY